MLVTRASHQASALADALTGHGLQVLAIPAIEIVPPSDDFAALDDALEDLDSTDWLIFTSANAVNAYAERARELAAESQGVRIASIGAATSRALLAAGMHVDLQPPQAVAESLAEALRPYARGSRMLLVRAEQAREDLPALLRAAGAELQVVAAYCNQVPAQSVSLLQRMGGQFDAITFTSSSSVTHLLDLYRAAKLTLPRQAVLASIGPITSATLREVGLQPSVEASAAEVEILAAELARYLHRQVRL